MSINTELTALADAIRAKSGTEGKLSISGMTTAVNNIVIDAGDDIDLSGVTVTADKMLSGIVAVGATGEKVTGNIPTVTASSNGEKVTVPVGYIASEQTFDVGSDGYDTSAVTVTADTMLAGKIAVGKNGETITGNIATATPSLSGRTFTVAKGYVAENFEASVPEATVTETENKVTISAGYVSSELSYDLGGGGIDTTTSVPPSAADVRLGKEFWANGAKYTGTMPDAVVTTETLDGGNTDTRLTITAGYLENDFSIDYLSSGFQNLPFITATAADIREGKVGADAEGNPITGTLVVGGDTPAPASGFSVAKVAEYIPYSPAFNGITEIEVSNIGYVGNQDEDWGQDYSEANGKYVVTEDTYYETDEKKRVYKHESKNYWIMFYDDSEWGNWGYNYWVITPYEGDSEPYSAVVCVEESNFTTGVSEWYNMEYDMPVDVGIATTITNKPEQPMVLNGYMAGGYDEAEMDWLFSETLTEFTGFDVTPKVGEMYNTFGGRLIGGSLGHDPGDMESNAVMYSNPGNGTGAGINGRVVPYVHKSVVDGVPCVWFDIETAGQQSDAGIGSRESYAYIPLNKTISLRRSDYYPVPKPPYNQMSIIGTMYSPQWGNSGHIIGLSKEVNAATSQWGGDNYRGAFLGVNFDPNYGFKVDSASGYPEDYKKMYNEFNGKWMQFVLTVSENNVRLYLNGELRVTAYNIDFSGYNPAEFNYLFFRQSDGMGELMYFGKMYVFDRVLSNSEIARAYKTLQSMELPPFTGLPDGYKFRASFSNAIAAETGQALSVTGNPEITTKNGVPCAYFDGTAEISTQLDVDSWTDRESYVAISAWIKIDPAQYENIRSICGFEQVGYHLDFSRDNAYCSSEWMHILMQSSYGRLITNDPNYEASHHSEIWINGFKTSKMSLTAWGVLSNTLGIGNYLNSNKERFIGHIAEVIVYNRGLRESEIKQLAAQYAKKTVAGGDDEW